MLEGVKARSQRQSQSTASHLRRTRGGAGGGAGHAVNPAPRSGPAAGGCAFERMRANASHAMHSHPWGLDVRLARSCNPAQAARPGLGVLPNPSGACAGPIAHNGPAPPPTPPHGTGGQGTSRARRAKRNGVERNVGHRHSRLFLPKSHPPATTATIPLNTPLPVPVPHPNRPHRYPLQRVAGSLGRDRCAPWVRRMRRTGWAGRPTPVLPLVQDCTSAQGAHRAPMDGFTACPGQGYPPPSPGKPRRQRVP